ETAARTAGFHHPGLAVSLPHAGKENAWIGQVELDINAAGLVIHVENTLPGLATVTGAEDATGWVRSKWMSERGHEHGVRIFGVNNHAPDGIGVAQAGE